MCVCTRGEGRACEGELKRERERERVMASSSASVERVRDEVNLVLGRGEGLLAVKAAVSELEKPEDFEERFEVFLYALQGANRSGNVAIPKGELSMQEEDLMMQFLYRGLSKADSTTNALMLKYFKSLVDVSGLGSIMRYIAS